ncbi:MAG TPA: glucokinase [Microvirga sp.]|jgi:glucokinase|nr:glucokinase [Microvirga sp.]
MFAFPVLIGDIGGTNARFAVLPSPGAPYTLLPRMLTAAAPTPVEAIRAALAAYDGPAPRSGMIAVANRVDTTAVTLTNAAWTVDAAEIGLAFGLERVTLVNDYTPVAASAALLDASRGDLAPVGEAGFGGSGARLVIGPGTGLGAGALAPVEGRFAVLATEAGHMELGPVGGEELALWPHIEPVLGRISGEALLSGPGLLRLATALARLRGEPVAFAGPHQILESGREGLPVAVEALTLFARLLGRFAGDLALAFEARGGVFIAGGIAPRMVDILQGGALREAFDRKAPHEAWARAVPVSVVVHPEPALLGLSGLASEPGRFIFSSRSWDG